LALEYVTPGKIYRLTVETFQPAIVADQAQLVPTGYMPGSGAPSELPTDDLITTREAQRPPAPVEQHWTPEGGTPRTADGDPALGALIGREGGSSADLKIDKTLLFGVGRQCVFSVADTNKAGSLYLGANDTLVSSARVSGQLEVTVSEAL
jgi:hypothetical protein